jgi:hypothetical protein
MSKVEKAEEFLIESIVFVLTEVAKRRTPEEFRAFLLGGAIANSVGRLPDDYWREFMRVEPCGEPGCDCQVVAAKMVTALDALREDRRKTMMANNCARN